MAKIEEVRDALVSTCAATKSASENVAYFAGWPLPEQLEDDIKANISNVSVYPYGNDKQARRPINPRPEVIQAVGSDQVLIRREKQKQLKMFQINIWAPTPEQRGVIADALKTALDDLDHLIVNANEKCKIVYRNQMEDDSEQKTGIYRRIYFYEIEYSTYKTETVYKACLPRIVNGAGQIVEEGSSTSVLVNKIP